MNNKRRREKKSLCIKTSIEHLGTKYKEIEEPHKLLNLFNKQSGLCFWCNNKLECPKVENTSYEYNYNIATLDRIDNTNKLHTIENVIISCHMCNIMRGQLNMKRFDEIIRIFRGESNILDLSDIPFINKITDKRFTISYKRVRHYINPHNVRELICPISNLPLFLSLKFQDPLLPSWDRIINNDEYGNKMDHSDNNITMVSAIVNRGRNNINTLDDFIKIFNNKFPNRCKNINVIYPDNYVYIEKHGCFVNKKYSIELWKGTKITIKQKFINRIKRIISHINKINKVKDWYIENGNLPSHKNEKYELSLYNFISEVKNYKIYNHLLTFMDNRTQKEKQKEEWFIMYNKLISYINDNGKLPNVNGDKKLYNWIGTQRRNFKSNKLNKEYIDELNKIPIWWWTEIHQGYLNNIKWFNENKKIIPKKKDNNTQYSWFSKIKKFYLLETTDQKSLSNYERELLINNIPIFKEWIKHGCPKTKKESKEFYSKYK